MQINIDKHARDRAEERGTTEDEIYETVKTGKYAVANSNRTAKEKIYSFNKELNGKFYREKLVKVIYIVENEVIIVITVVVKYGNFT